MGMLALGMLAHGVVAGKRKKLIKPGTRGYVAAR